MIGLSTLSVKKW